MRFAKALGGVVGAVARIVVSTAEETGNGLQLLTSNSTFSFCSLKEKYSKMSLIPYSDHREREHERADSWRSVAPNSTIMVSSLPLHVTENEVFTHFIFNVKGFFFNIL